MVDDIYLLEEWNSAAGALRLGKISGPVGGETYVPGTPLSLGPPWNWAPPAPNHAPQSGSPPARRIATNDARIQNLVYRNGTLWATHTVFFDPPDRASVQWWELTTTASVVQRGLIDDATGVTFYAFPSIAVNAAGDALIGFSCFSPTQFASGCYAFRKASDPPNTFQDVATLKGGEAKYDKVGGSGINRWGDYSATVVDPVNDMDLWTIQEYAMTPMGTDRWGTWWGHLAPEPQISINDVTRAEGNSGNTTFSFTISLSFPSTQTVTVSWAAADDTAKMSDGDFLAAGGPVSFPPGVTSQVVDVQVVGDFKHESDETFFVNLTAPGNATIADSQGLGTILNDDPVPRITIDDVRVIEGSTAVFTVTLSNPSAFTVSVDWNTTDGTAVAPGDYSSTGGTVLFASPSVAETLSVSTVADGSFEPNETFHVDLSAPANGLIGRPRGVGTILDDDATRPDVGFLTVVSDGNASVGHNRLQWMNPVSGTPPSEIHIRFTEGASCTPPAVGGACPAADCILVNPVGAPGMPAFHDHNNLTITPATSYCYTVWAMYGASPSAGVSVEGHPFDATATKLKWKYATGTGTTGVAPPSVGFDGVFAVDNFGDVHAMARTELGGEWPSGPPLWFPLNLGSPSQARNPVVPLSLGSLMYIGTQDGGVHAVDAKSGSVVWSTTMTPSFGGAAPAGVFTAFGGEHDAILTGTSDTDDNVFYALDPTTGALIDTFGPAEVPLGIGRIAAMAVVDYRRLPQNRVYFATVSTGATDPRTLWCLELGPPGPVSFSLKWAVDVGNISGSPVLRNGRIYVGTDAGEVLSVDAETGGNVRTTGDLGDGPVKGFVFPDRASGDVYLSTTTRLWRLTDDGSTWVTQWSKTLSNPSTPLYWPGTTLVYVGDDGKLYQFDTLTQAENSIALDFDPPFVVGTPTLDLPNAVIHLGSEKGTFFAVKVPLP
jgi:outer membrane protein assembly factor BamB